MDYWQKIPFVKLAALVMAVYIIHDVSVKVRAPKHIEEITFNWERDLRRQVKHAITINRDPEFDFQKEMNKLNSAKVKPDDPRLVSLIRNYYIEPPSLDPYKLREPHKRDSSFGQAMFIDGILENKENGFFVDSGAHNGEDQSNTLFFERIRHWTGILIEPQPQIYKELKMKNRKAYTLNACVCANQDYPSTVQFKATSFYGGIAAPDDHAAQVITVQCFPFYSILLAMNQTNVDYFSLDVEGAEEGILNTIPWKLVNIKTFSIEYDKFNGGDKALRNYMAQRGYEWMVKMDSIAALDCIFKLKNKGKYYRHVKEIDWIRRLRTAAWMYCGGNLNLNTIVYINTCL